MIFKLNVKPRPHQQQCRSNVVEAIGNNVEATFDFVEATFAFVRVERIVRLVAFDSVVAGVDGALDIR